MTVAELVRLLQALPQDLPVYLGDWNEEYAPDIPIDYKADMLPRVVDGTVLVSRKYPTCRRVVIG